MIFHRRKRTKDSERNADQLQTSSIPNDGKPAEMSEYDKEVARVNAILLKKAEKETQRIIDEQRAHPQVVNVFAEYDHLLRKTFGD